MANCVVRSCLKATSCTKGSGDDRNRVGVVDLVKHGGPTSFQWQAMVILDTCLLFFKFSWTSLKFTCNWSTLLVLESEE